MFNDRHHSTFDSKPKNVITEDIVPCYIVSLSEEKCFEFTLKDINDIAA